MVLKWVIGQPQLLHIEDELRKSLHNADEFAVARSAQSEPVLQQLCEWLVEYYPQVPPRSLLGNAIRYCLAEWEKLIRYLDHPLLAPSNNIAKNALRPFVIGSKNWLFSDSQGGAHASAAWYSVVECATANGIEPYAYFRYLPTVLPFTPKEKLRDLMPYNIDLKRVEIIGYESGMHRPASMLEWRVSSIHIVRG
jgi:transposase